MELTKKISNEELNELKELWYRKIAYGDLVIGDSSAPLHVRDEYVKATQKYSEYSAELIAKYFENKQPKNWSCDFSTGELTAIF